MKLFSHVLALALAGLVALSLAGCGQVTYVLQQYDGPARAPEQVGVLRIQHDDSAMVVSMDGEALGPRISASDVRLHIEMLPGQHTLVVKNPGADAVSTQHVRFVAEPGRVYRVLVTSGVWHTESAKPAPAGTWSALVYEVERADGRLLREVSLPPASS